MVALLKRMRRLQSQLLNIRLGPGAATISGDVSRIHLSFAKKINDGHFGPRKFWRIYLPRLKYHNPGVRMTVERGEDQAGPASLTVFFQPRTETQASSEQSSPESSKVIDMKHKHESQILTEFLKMVGGQPILATAVEEQQLEELEAARARGEVDRVRTRKVLEEKKRQEAILARAKASAAVEAL